MASHPPQPILVPQAAGKLLEFISVRHKLTGAQTGGAYYIFDSVWEPGAGNRLHVHSREDEFAYVLKGALEVRLPDQVLVVEAGGMAHLPRHIPHALRSPLETASHYLFMAVPAGMDQWFDALDAARQAGTLNPARFDELALEFGIEFLE
jgi:quercetin dioxygenase-like cupin family protein